jgi:hypothetical protein
MLPEVTFYLNLYNHHWRLGDSSPFGGKSLTFSMDDLKNHPCFVLLPIVHQKSKGSLSSKGQKGRVNQLNVLFVIKVERREWNFTHHFNQPC